MKADKLTIAVDDEPGQVSAEWMEGEATDAVFVFAHGAGAPMSHPFMTRLSEALAGYKIATLRFNFPYMERRSRRPDVPAVAERTVRHAVAEAVRRSKGVLLIAGGKSFGGRMTSQAMAKESMDEVSALVFTGFPLHPAGKPGTDRAAHLKEIKIPMLFLQGTRDALAEKGLMEGVCNSLELATLLFLDGADHSFKAGKNDLIPILADHIQHWVRQLAR